MEVLNYWEISLFVGWKCHFNSHLKFYNAVYNKHTDEYTNIIKHT